MNKYIRTATYLALGGLAILGLRNLIVYRMWDVFIAQEVFLVAALTWFGYMDRVISRHHKALKSIRDEAEETLNEAEEVRGEVVSLLNSLLGREYIGPTGKGGD